MVGNGGLPLLGAQRSGAQPRRVPRPFRQAVSVLLRLASSCRASCSASVASSTSICGAVRMFGADHPHQTPQPSLLRLATSPATTVWACASRHIGAGARRGSLAIRGDTTRCCTLAASRGTGHRRRRSWVPVRITTPVNPPAAQVISSCSVFEVWSACAASTWCMCAPWVSVRRSTWRQPRRQWRWY